MAKTKHKFSLIFELNIHYLVFDKSNIFICIDFIISILYFLDLIFFNIQILIIYKSFEFFYDFL